MYENGWQIFQILRSRRWWSYVGELITTGHLIIAARAWDTRPIPWYDIGRLVGDASIDAPETARYLAELTANLVTSDDCDDITQGREILYTWSVHNEAVETRYLAELGSQLYGRGHPEYAQNSSSTPLKI
ncbi:MAG: hypothetical protein ACREX9_13195 [Gammaproteobacteria bacterium]